MKRLNKYDKYKDSEIEWIGKIPEHWDLTKLKYVTKCLDGRRIPLSAEERGEKQGDIPYWGANGIIDYVNDYLIDEEVVLLGEDGAPFFDKSKDVAFYSNGKIWPNNHIHILQPTKIYIKLLVYLLNAVDYTDYINGSTRDKLTQSDMGNINLLSIPFDEQQAIANFLDQKNAEIDSLIADKEKLIELLQEKRQAIITQAVTKGLDPNVPMKDSGIEWVGEIPEHWEVVPLFKAFSEHQHKNTNNKEDNVLSLSYGKIIRRNIETNYGLLPESFETYNVVQPGFIVLRLTDLQNDKHSLRCGLVKEKGIITSAYVTIKKRCNDVNPSYFYYLLHGYDLLKVFYNMGGGVRQSLKYNELKRMPIVVPNECEQKTIAEFLDKKTSELDNLILEMKLQIEKLREYRQSLITAAVTGKIDVRDYIVDNDKEEGEEQEEVS